MNKIIIKILLLIIILQINLNANAANIVYPHKNNVVISAPCSFFIGNEKPDTNLKINGEAVKLHKNGAFRHNVDLKFGENIFVIDNGSETKTYKIHRPHPIMKMPARYPDPITYENSKYVKIKADNTPLRSTANDTGVNRLQHLQKDIILEAIGEYKGFYKIKLDDVEAWISKEQVDIADINEPDNAKIEYFSYYENDDSKIFSMKLNRKVPYILKEENGLKITIYNVKAFNSNKYEFNIENNGKLYGYGSKYTDDNELIITVKNKPKFSNKNPLENIKITIDPGHGGKEIGATGCLGEKEKDVNLKIAQKLKEKLLNNGATVFMTREDDTAVGLYDRVKFANKNSQIFISIHCNALPDNLANSDITGTEVYYFYPQAKNLADNIIKSITKKTGLNDHGVRAQSFAVVRNTENVSILLEVGYIINPEEEEKIINPQFQDDIVDGIIQGLENYIKE